MGNRRGYGRLWGNRNFATILASQAAGDIGQGLSSVVLTWYVLEQGGPAMLGILISGRCLPYLLFSALAGVAADRIDRRRAMIVADGLTALVALLFPILAGAGLLGAWPAVALGFAFDTLREFSSVARRSLVPRVVPRDAYVAAVSLNSVTFRLGNTVGAGLVGLLSRAFGLINLYALIGACMAVAAVAVSTMRAPREVTAGPGELARARAAAQPNLVRAVAADLVQGFRAALKNPFLRTVFTLDGLYFTFAHGPLMVGLPMLIKSLGGDAGTLGFVQAAGSGMSLLVVILAGQYLNVARYGPTLVGGWLGFALAIFAVGFSTSPGMAAIAYSVQQSCGFLVPLSSQVIIQNKVPPDELGKAFGVWDTIAPGFGVVSAALAGIAARTVPVAVLFCVGGAVSLTATLIARLSVVWREG